MRACNSHILLNPWTMGEIPQTCPQNFFIAFGASLSEMNTRRVVRISVTWCCIRGCFTIQLVDLTQVTLVNRIVPKSSKGGCWPQCDGNRNPVQRDASLDWNFQTGRFNFIPRIVFDSIVKKKFWKVSNLREELWKRNAPFFPLLCTSSPFFPWTSPPPLPTNAIKVELWQEPISGKPEQSAGAS